MPNQERLESGEKVFIITFLLAFFVEVILAVSSALAVSWVGMLVSTFCACFVLYLANQLYGGDAAARNLAQIWVGAMLLLGVLGIVAPDVGRFLGMAAPWAGGFKILAYLLLGASLLVTRSSRYFVAIRTGETVATEEKILDEPVATGVTLKLTSQQAAPVADLMNSLNCASITMFVLGALFVLNALKDGLAIPTASDEFSKLMAGRTALLFLGQGVLALLLGGFLRRPTAAVRDIQENNADTGFILSALSQLKGLFVKHLIVTVLFAALTVVQIVLWVMSAAA